MLELKPGQEAGAGSWIKNLEKEAEARWWIKMLEQKLEERS